VTYRIVWYRKAREDLLALYDWIDGQAGPEMANDYTNRIDAHAAKLGDFPHRGTPRNDLAPGLRTITYRRRTIIAYKVVGEEIQIWHILHGGRDLAGVFDEMDE
jgi:toxin ParE1/3/4